MEWGVCVKQTEEDIQVDGVVSFYLNHPTQRGKYQCSVFGRLTRELGFLAGQRLLSAMKIVCSEVYNIRSLKGDTKGTFEVIVSYPLFPRKCVADGFRR